MTPLPSLFLSHGSPMHAVQAGRAGALWTELGRNLPRPRAILIASAHTHALARIPFCSTRGADSMRVQSAAVNGSPS